MTHNSILPMLTGAVAIALVSGAVCGETNATASRATGDLPKHIRMVLTEDVASAAIVTESIFISTNKMTHWKPDMPSSLSTVELPRITFKQERNQTLETIIEFMFKGDTNASRRVVVDFHVKTMNNKRLFHSWWIAEDARLLPNQIGMMAMSKINSARFKVPPAIVSRMQEVEIAFRDISTEDLRHFPDKPPEYGLTVTEPLNDTIRISFTNPDMKHLTEEVNAFVVVLNVMDSEGKTVDKIVQNYGYKRLNSSERHVFTLPIPKDLYDHSSCEITFYTKQPENEAFIQRFFVEGKGGSYRGMWTSTGGKLWRLPLEQKWSTGSGLNIKH